MNAKRERTNVRFWILWKGWTRVTLYGRDVPHTLYRSERTDEGWSSESETFTLTRDEHGRDVVIREWCSDGRDCDGRLTRSGVLECTVKRLSAEAPLTGKRIGNTRLERDSLADVRRPAWREIDSAQRDYAAEAAGY